MYYTFPDADLCQYFIENGADPQQLSFLHSYFTYRKKSKEQNEFYRFVYNLATKYRLDVNEVDVSGKNCVAVVYESLLKNPMSVDENIRQDHSELQFLRAINCDFDHRCMDDVSIGRTVLLDSAYKGRRGLFEYLLRVGADPDQRCVRGRSLGDYIKMDFQEQLRDGTTFQKTEFIKNQLR